MFVIENKNHKEPAKQQQLDLLSAHYGSMYVKFLVHSWARNLWLFLRLLEKIEKVINNHFVGILCFPGNAYRKLSIHKSHISHGSIHPSVT